MLCYSILSCITSTKCESNSMPSILNYSLEHSLDGKNIIFNNNNSNKQHGDAYITQCICHLLLGAFFDRKKCSHRHPPRRAVLLSWNSPNLPQCLSSLSSSGSGKTHPAVGQFSANCKQIVGHVQRLCCTLLLYLRYIEITKNRGSWERESHAMTSICRRQKKNVQATNKGAHIMQYQGASELWVGAHTYNPLTLNEPTHPNPKVWERRMGNTR